MTGYQETIYVIVMHGLAQHTQNPGADWCSRYYSRSGETLTDRLIEGMIRKHDQN